MKASNHKFNTPLKGAGTNYRPISGLVYLRKTILTAVLQYSPYLSLADSKYALCNKSAAEKYLALERWSRHCLYGEGGKCPSSSHCWAFYNLHTI